MMPQRFHKQLKVFRKAELKRIPVRKPWNHAINLRKDFIPKKGRTYLILREKKKSKRTYGKAVKKRVYQIFKVTLDFTSVLYKKKE